MIKFPRHDTLTGRALARLLEGRRFTHRDFQRETASYRLSSYIEQLRNRHGWPIESKKESGKTLDPVGRKAEYARYFFNKENLINLRSEVGTERIEKFIESVRKFENK